MRTTRDLTLVGSARHVIVRRQYVLLLVMAVTICRPRATFSVTDRFRRFSLIRAIFFSSVHVYLNGKTTWEWLHIESWLKCLAPARFNLESTRIGLVTVKFNIEFRKYCLESERNNHAIA